MSICNGCKHSIYHNNAEGGYSYCALKKENKFLKQVREEISIEDFLDGFYGELLECSGHEEK